MESSKASVPSCWQNLPSWNVQPASWLCELWLAPSLQLTAFCAAGWQPKMGLQLDWRFKREAAGKCLTPNYVCVCVCVTRSPPTSSLPLLRCWRQPWL